MEENEILGEDIDRVYEEIRDNNTITAIELTEDLIKEISKMPYYKDNQKRVCKDIIQTILNLGYKIEVKDLSEKFQSIDLEVKNGN